MRNSSDDVFEEFRVEMVEMAQQIDEDLLRWEAMPTDHELPRRMLRQLHTLKGSAGFLELPELADLCHAGEDLLGVFRDQRLGPNRAILGVFSQLVARVQAALTSGAEEEETRSSRAIIQMLARLTDHPELTLEELGIPEGCDSGEEKPEGEGDDSAAVEDRSLSETSETKGGELSDELKAMVGLGTGQAGAEGTAQEDTGVPSETTSSQTPSKRDGAASLDLEARPLLGSSLLGAVSGGRELGGFALGPWSGNRLHALQQGRSPQEMRQEAEAASKRREQLPQVDPLDLLLGKSSSHLGEAATRTSVQGISADTGGISGLEGHGEQHFRELREAIGGAEDGLELNAVAEHVAQVRSPGFGEGGHLEMALDGSLEPVSGEDFSRAKVGVLSPEEASLFTERATTVRVGVQKLDTLLNLLGDLLQEKHRQAVLVERMIDEEDRDETVIGMVESQVRLGRMLRELQDAVLGTRMLPIQGVFRRYPRIVREHANRMGKEVELHIAGEETELDRALLEGMFEPLIHLLRNSIDHGIEAPAERVRRQKPRKGRIELLASQEGQQIVLEIRDDGVGIDPHETARQAGALGLLNPDRAEEMNDQEKIDLIFLSGFTSRSTATETSGRGIGMSVVRDHLRRIGGLITVHSRPGEGTTLRIAMPLTLAIIQVVLVKLGQTRYAIPLSSVVKVQKIQRDRLAFYRGGWYLPSPGTMLPVYSLSVLLGIEDDPSPPERSYIAEVGVAEKRYGILVDGFAGIYESVIKSLEGSLTRLPGVVGGTAIGGGDMVLVLDVGTLLEGKVSPLKGRA